MIIEDETLDITKRIEYAKNILATKLDISGIGIDSLPDSIGQLTQLTELNISDNKISILPESFWKLIKLQILNIGFNNLTILSEFIGQLNQLQTKTKTRPTHSRVWKM